MYLNNPAMIEKKSMEIIEQTMVGMNFNENELTVVKRMIHTTGDFDYQNIVVFKDDPINTGLKLLAQGCRIFTDTRMAWSGINKKALKKSGSELKCYIDDERVKELAQKKGTTRSYAAVDIASQDQVDIYVIGNAPTALFRIGELIKQGRVSPSLIIGVPVGFVGAAESKEFIRELDIPSITTVGTKGGSNVAASIVNALLYMAVGR
ncbi:MAG: precorrin-8X methylmutase [Thermacetogeniaceae bacterium]|mgnify:FL=1|jgi:precorrin-8X/cobalt-precorrin-8 methylmutase|nr:precorrin-8X methylmutase [Thermoanaerobacterales bacterium]NLN21510.1 precorrin-8X methylmutase [Syntrophomonadaceae bacterium]